MSDDDSSRSEEVKIKQGSRNSRADLRSKNLKNAPCERQSDLSDPPSNKKRGRLQDDEVVDMKGFAPEDFSKMSRSERKRHREKKRRSDVNKGFDDLMGLLLEIDPVVREEAEERARRGQFKGSIGAQEDNLLSRVDLITRTVEVLRRIHRENEERKIVIANLTKMSGARNSAAISESLQGALPSAMQRTLQGSQLLAATRNESQVSTILPRFSSDSATNADAIALQAAIRRNQLQQTRALSFDFRDPRIAGIAAQQSVMLGISLPNELLGSSVLGRNVGSSAASSFAGLPRVLGLANQGVSLEGGGAPSDLSRRYLQLIQEQEAAAAARYGQTPNQHTSSIQLDKNRGNNHDMTGKK